MNCLMSICGSKKRTIWFVIFAFLSVSIMVTIFCFSAQPAEISQNTSNGFFAVIESLARQLFSGTLPSGVVLILQVFRMVLRKLAHGFVYFLLGSCLTGMFYCTLLPKQLWKKGLCAVVIAVFYAITDETHQLFVMGRSGEVRDVLIDSVGIVFGVSITLLIFVIAKKRKKRKER